MFETMDIGTLVTAIIGIIVIAVPAAYIVVKRSGKEVVAELSGALTDVADAANDSAAVMTVMTAAWDDDKFTEAEIKAMKDKAMEVKTHMEAALKHAQTIADKFGKK